MKDLTPPKEVSDAHVDARIDLLSEMEKDFVARHPDVSPHSHLTAYDRAIRLMRTDAAKAFNVEEEKREVRDRYGRNLFGQGCLLARRLVERGVPFVEVTLGGVDGNGIGWDTHSDNFNQVKRLSGVLDPAWAALMSDLKERGLLDTTLIVWMGEFGRTPKIERQWPRPLPQRLVHRPGRRRHQGRQAYGQTSGRRHGGRGEAGAGAGLHGDRHVRAGHRSRRSRTNPTSVGPSASPTRRQADQGGPRMRRAFFVLPLLAALAVLPAPAAPPAPAAAEVDEDDDVQDMIFFSDTRPVIIRLHIRVDGKPYGAAWEAYVHELFNYLDRNGDGVLSKDEASHAPDGAAFQQLRQFGVTRGIGAVSYASFSALDADEDEEVTFEEFRAYYRHHGAGGLSISVSPLGRAATADPLTDALFKPARHEQGRQTLQSGAE